MARGVVCIASDVAEYRLLQKEGAPLLLARDEREWREHLSRLIEDEDYRRSFRVREWVMSHYDLHANAERYIQAIHQIREWKRRGIGGKGEYRPIKPHDRCPCGSGLKYSRCCYPAFG
jgi:spore maturation protein CgeB